MHGARLVPLLAIAVVLFLPACGGGGGNAARLARADRPHPSDELLFVRDGIVIPAGAPDFAVVGKTMVGGRPHSGVRYGPEALFVTFPTAPGDRVFTKHRGKLRSGQTPQQVTAWRIDSIPLEDVRNVTLTGNLADSVTAIAGTTVAVGTYTGKLHLRRLIGGGPPASTQLVRGGMVKALAFPPEDPDRPFPPDGTAEPSLLYAGEQSPRGRFRALALPGLTERWGFDLAEDLGEGTLPGPENPYGIYELPGVFQIVARQRRVFFVGVRSFSEADGSKQNRSRLYCYSPAGERLWAWPPDGYAPLNILR
ncbi:MAG TPA: hypothetical protein VEI97_20955, partial [bacterium]|nr:hypothetical protein [bacterium]